MASLGPTFGRGAMTNHWVDIKNSDVIFVCGGNPAENHPIAFKWVTKAQENGAKLIVVDPRFTRSASHADFFAHIRPGTDIAFFGGLINYVISNDLHHVDYVKAYTNATFLVDEEYSFKDGLFSGFDTKEKTYNQDSWAYQMDADGNVVTDETMSDPRCVFQIVKNHYSRYTPEVVSKVCGIPKSSFDEIAKLYATTGKAGKSGTLLYAMGLTQHTVGVQNIRAFTIIQQLLGNMGMPGGGVNALRGESNVQGSTDMALLFHIIPAYMPTPSAAKHPTLDKYKEATLKSAGSGYWKNTPKFMVSLLKAFWGDAATAANSFAYDYMPKIGKGFQGAGYSWIALFEAMYAGDIKGLMCWGQNPAISGPNSNLEMAAMDKLDWMVVADLWETDTSVFWKRPGAKPENIDTEVFLLPAAASYEKEGSITNSGRVLQWRWKGADPPGDAKHDLWILDQLYKEIKKLYEDASDAVVPEPIVNLNWDYGKDDPDVHIVAKEINGHTWADKKQVANFTKLKDDGSTACGNWIYSGFYPGPDKTDNKSASRDSADDPGGLGLYPKWGFAWPVNRRIIYNRCSADPEGKPWNPDKVLVEWDGSKWIRNDVPDFGWKNATTGAQVPPAKSAKSPFIMLDKGKSRMFVAKGQGARKDGPIPEHYEPIESPVKNELSSKQTNPAVKIWGADKDTLTKFGDKVCPIIATTYRVTEHWQAGSMSRNLPWLAELMPEMFVEISEELAERKKIENGEWVKVASARGEVMARAIVTNRIVGFEECAGKPELAGLPYHFGFNGYITGGPEKKNYAANQLSPHVGDANTMIPEYKAFLVDVRKVD